MTKDFDKLKAKWYAKLEKSGFIDIENDDGSLKKATDPRTIAHALAEKEEREAYYSIAREFLLNYKFHSAQERRIWEEHCEGNSIKGIAADFKLKPHKVELILKTLKEEAKLWKTK